MGSTKKTQPSQTVHDDQSYDTLERACRAGRCASGSLAHPGAHFLPELGDEREECFVLHRLRNVIGEEEGFVHTRDERGPRDLAIEMRHHYRNDQRFGVDEGREAESPRFERQRRALGRGGCTLGTDHKVLTIAQAARGGFEESPPPLLSQ